MHLRKVSALQMQITILIADRLSTITHADTIHVLEQGRIVDSGGYDGPLDRKGLYDAICRQQIGESNQVQCRGEALASGGKT